MDERTYAHARQNRQIKRKPLYRSRGHFCPALLIHSTTVSFTKNTEPLTPGAYHSIRDTASISYLAMESDASSNAPQEIAGAGALPPAPGKLKLYSFWGSSCSHRVRIALNLKGLEYEYKPVNLLTNEQSDAEFEKLNPIKYVPALMDGDTVIADSFAILLYLEDMYPQHPLLPKDPQKRALNIQIASIVGSSIQPLQNYPVLNFIEEKLDSNEAIRWIQHQINRGFTALEKLLKGCSTKYATGNEIQLADVFLEPQIYGGIKRFGINMSIYPVLGRLHEAYLEHPAFLAALPEKQPDAPSQ